jgi:hypothetical protein
MTDEEILALYSQWSEEHYCAGFLTPDSLSIQAFRKWFHDPRKLYLRPVQYDYEREMLEEFHKQEEEKEWLK